MTSHIVQYPDPILSEIMPEFDFKSPIIDPIELEKTMLDIMYKCDGIGLAANQIGVRTRMFVMGHRANQSAGMGFFNPIVVETTEEIENLEEGCLSFPGIFVKVKRPNKIKARWQNAKGEFLESEFSGYECKCYLHELDHLEGIVFRDRVSPLRWSMSLKKRAKRN